MAGISKRIIWLKFFLDQDNKDTFLNGTESARAAGYKAATDSTLAGIGSNNFKALKKKIDIWLEEEGLSDTALKMKLLNLLEAKETKFFAHQGCVTDEREVEALEVQRRSLDMAFKIKGSYAPEKREHSGPNGAPIQTEERLITAEMSAKEAADLYAAMIKGDDG